MKFVKTLAIFLISLSAIFATVLGETPGAEPFPTNETDAATFSWQGKLEVGEKKTIKIEVLEKSYIHERYVEGSRQPTVTFLVFHDNPSGWGKSIQDLPKDKFTGPGGHVEKTNLPLSKVGNKWIGEVTIVPKQSIRSIAIWQRPNKGGVHVGYNIQVFTEKEKEPAGFTQKQEEKASKLHKKAWEMAAAKASGDRYYQFALYSSRSLAVKHPEIYLKGDGLFLDHITSTTGFSKAYKETNFQSQKLIDGYSGPPFNLDRVDLSSYNLQGPKEFYPEKVPYYDFLDLRVEPVSSVLKTQSKHISQIEKAFLLYFVQKKEIFPPPFIIYCDNHHAYLTSHNKLISAKTGKEVDNVRGNPILIFNEHSVWYPLMGRDETENDNLLSQIVSRYSTENSLPELSEFERKIIPELRNASSLESKVETNLAKIAAVRASPLGSDAFSSLFQRQLRSYPRQIWHGLTLNWIKRANYLSPFSAYLAGIIDSQNLESSVEKLVNRWHWDYEYRWGHIWKCGVVEYTIDEVRRTHYFHCVTHAVSLSSVLDLARINNLLIQGSWGDPGVTHTYVAIPELGFVLSNGELANKNTVINKSQKDWDTLWFISNGEKWAFPYINYYCGNLPPKELAQTLEQLEGQYGDHFNGFKSSQGKGKTHFHRSYLESGDYIRSLYQEQKRWEPFELP